MLDLINAEKRNDDKYYGTTTRFFVVYAIKVRLWGSRGKTYLSEFTTVCELFITCLICLILFSCGKKEPSISFEKKEVDEVSVLLHADSSGDIAVPTWIKSVSDGFLLYDDGLKKIIRMNAEGRKLLAFGGEGRGPGEYQSVGGFWKFDDMYLVYDINSRKLITYDHTGTSGEDLLLNFVEFPSSPVGIEAINPKQFIMPSGGRNGTLLTLVDIESESIWCFGKAVGEEYVLRQSSEELRQAVSSRNIPAMYKNRVLLSSNQTGIFSFQQTTALLEKYSHSGELIWQKSVKVPAIDGLFKDLFEKNRDRMNSGKTLLPFIYGLEISANKKGVAVLLNVFEDQLVTLVWVPNHGKKVTVVTFRGIKIEYPDFPILRFSISDNGSDIFFSSTLWGVVYRAEWPL